MINNFIYITKLSNQAINKNIIIAFFFIILSLSLEIIGLGIFLPILNIIVLDDYSFIENIFTFFEFNIDKSFYFKIILIGTAIIFFIKFLISVSYLWFQNFFLSDVKKFYFNKFFSHYMSISFLEFQSKQTSDILRNIRSTNIFGIYLYNFIQLFSDIIILFGISIFLLYINFTISIIAFLFLVILSLSYIFFVKKKLDFYGRELFDIDSKVLNWLKQSIENIKEVKIYKIESLFSNNLKTLIDNEKKINIKKLTFSSIHKYLFEFLLIILFIAILLFLNDSSQIKKYIPVLGIYVLSTFRLIPIINRILSSYQILIINNDPIQKLINEIKNFNQETVEFSKLNNLNRNTYSNINFREINIKNLNFEYDSDKLILKDVNLKISKGDKIFLKGFNGSGKTTFLNLITGLLKITKGEVEIDSNLVKLEEFTKKIKISYVPQKVTIFNMRLNENISLKKNMTDEDLKKIQNIIVQTGLNKYFPNPEVIDKTILGDSGSKLSGGQIQRIGIARALFRDPQILILDESTNALDEETEKSILKQLFFENKNMTILFVSHNPSNQGYASKVFEFKNKSITSIVVDE